ncbi:MAG: hypothetical protein LUP95_01020 [Euryarchaeota archaeon]|nr:hypothetical protein [Euryarchaeota archaeon]
MLPLQSVSLPLLMVVPGLSTFLLYRNGRNVELHTTISYALSLSLLMVPVSATTLLLLNISASLTGPFIGSVIVILSLLSFAAQQPHERSLLANRVRERRALMLALPILLSLVLALFVSVPLAKTLVINEEGLVMHPTEASDMNFHLSIISRFVESQHVPPEDPYLPTYYIVYNWFMHVYIGTLAISSGISALLVFKLAIPVLLFTLAMNTYVLCRYAFNNATALIAMLLYTLGGGLAWIVILLVQPAEQPTDLFLYLIYQFSDTATIKYDQTILFYLLPQTETFALVILTFAFVVWTTLVKSLKLKSTLLFGLVLGLLPYYHVITALPLFAAVGVYTVFTYVKKDTKGAKYSFLSLLVGSAVALPQVLLLVGGQNQAEIAFSTYSLYFMFLVYGLIAILAAVGAYRSLQNEAARPLMYFALCVLVLMGVIALPLTQNTYRFLVFLYLPIAVFASFYIASTIQAIRTARGLSRPVLLKIAAIVAALVLALPSTYMLWQFYNDETYTLATTDEVMALDWVKANTNKDAIFLEEPSTFPRVPLETGRRVAFAGPLYTIQYHGISLQQEIDTVMNERSSQSLSQDLQQLNVSYVFMGSREQRYELATTVEDQNYFESVYSNPTVTIYKVIAR